MSHMTRAEIVDLHARFVEKEPKLLGFKEGANTGTQQIAAALNKAPGVPPDPLLRNFGRVLKHYLEEARNPKQVDRVFAEFNFAVSWVARGTSHDQAVRRARTEVDESRRPELVKQKEQQKEKQRKLLDDARAAQHSHLAGARGPEVSPSMTS